MGLFRRLFRRRSAPASPKATASPSPAPAPASELERVFNKFDTNGDGKISVTELESVFSSLGHAISPHEVTVLMSEADTDGDGFISLAEFIDLNTRKVDPDAAMDDIRNAFLVFDVDRNGAISAEELAAVLRGIGEAASVAQCRMMIRGVDRDGDGVVSFEEFKIMMTRGGGVIGSGSRSE